VSDATLSAFQIRGNIDSEFFSEIIETGTIAARQLAASFQFPADLDNVVSIAER